MRRRIRATTVALAAALVAVLAVGTGPAMAVIGGTHDSANKFSNVGLVAVDGQPECSGTLYRTSPSQNSSVLVMTAAHCTSGVTGQFGVTFSPEEPDASTQYLTGTAYTHPAFAFPDKVNNSLNQFATSDLGVVVLDKAPKGIKPADLPSLGLVDTLDPKTTLLTAVGYGIVDFATANAFTYNGRNYKDATILEGQRTATGDKFLKISAATCFGDSGGPIFLKGTSTIVAVTSWIQSYVCSSQGYQYRIDQQTVLDFLRNPTTVGVRQ